MLTKIEEPGLLDVLDRILDKGIVVDAWIRFSLVGLDLLTVEARVVVASIETYLEYANTLRKTQPQSPPARNLAIVSAAPAPGKNPLARIASSVRTGFKNNN